MIPEIAGGEVKYLTTDKIKAKRQYEALRKTAYYFTIL